VDTISKIIAGPAVIWISVLCIVGLLSIGLGVYWLFNKQARLKDLAELRTRLDDLKATDPEYGAVRALYTSMLIDAERWGFFHADSGLGGDGGSAGLSGGDHVGDGVSGGSDH
jgi:hypothetical protein